MKQTSKINKAEQDYVDGKTTSVNVPNDPKSQAVSCNNLQDIEPTEDELNRFKEHLLRKGIKYEDCLD